MSLKCDGIIKTHNMYDSLKVVLREMKNVKVFI